MDEPHGFPRIALAALALGLLGLGGVGYFASSRTPARAHRPPQAAVVTAPVDVDAGAEEAPGAQRALTNREAVIPPQCYTRTEGRHNPCYVCHQAPIEGDGHENRINDGWLQGQYGFSEFALTNRWSNLFVDRTADVATISDDEIRRYVATENYSGLRTRLREAPATFRGWIPDLEGLEDGALAFDAEGLARDGSAWVAFNYMPMPSTFWPTNGSTDDVMIRLPAEFREAASGRFSKDVYFANLAILEAAMKGLDVLSSRPLDERAIGTDVDGDGRLGRVRSVRRGAKFVGRANAVDVVPFLFPQGTEFLHTVRYVGVDERGTITSTPRMKEVRYMVKENFIPASLAAGLYDNEVQEKIEASPPYYADHRDRGIANGFGWIVQGFLEDARGELRPSTYEETLFCMGCHSTIGSTIDHTFSFARKVDGPRGWGYIDLHGMPDAPSFGETEGQILTYLRRAGGGSEFRANDEMRQRWFLASGEVDVDAVSRSDVFALITPSPERALLLDKAYLVIVREQSFLRGRDPTVTPPVNVFAEIEREVVPLAEDRRYAWDIRVTWPTVD